MAQEKTKETKDSPAPPAAPEAPKVSADQLLAAAQLAEQRARLAEQRASMSEEALRQAQNAAPPPPAPQDPLIRYSNEDVTMSPDEKRRHLAAAIDGRAQMAAAQAERRMEERANQIAFATESRNAIANVTMRRPELADPRNSANFAAAMTKAKYEANASGYEPSPTQLVIAAEKAYDDMFKADRPPVTERSASGAGAQPLENAQTPQKNDLERIYKVKAGFIRPAYDVNDVEEMNSMNNEYQKARMAPMLKAGLNSDYANLLHDAFDEKES